MKSLKRYLGLMVVSLSQLSAEEFEAVNLSIESVKEEVLVYVQPEDSFHDILGMIKNNIPFQEGDSQEFSIHFAVNGSVVQARAVQVAAVARDYSAGVSSSQQEDIRYILKTLSNMHNMHGRNWVWKEFISGIIGSFNEEYARGNVKADQISNFIKTLKISPSLVNTSIQSQRWTELIDTLIAKIPREQGSDRYNM